MMTFTLSLLHLFIGAVLATFTLSDDSIKFYQKNESLISIGLCLWPLFAIFYLCKFIIKLYKKSR